MKLRKKIREIEDLEKKVADGGTLAANQQAKCAQKPTLLEELDIWEKTKEPHTFWHEATIESLMEPLFGIVVKIDAHTELKEMSAAHLNPPVPVDDLTSLETDAKYRKGNDIKVRFTRCGQVTAMTEAEEAAASGASQEILAALAGLRKKDEQLMEALWKGGYSGSQYEGKVSSIRDYCIFARVLGREVKVSPDDMKAALVWRDPSSGVQKVKRDAVVKDMDVSLRLKWDARQDRVIGSMIMQEKATVTPDE
mmetsp:Transcript_72714/g.190618  ORF Transcript_72714/g.190618 Transcript_72714/m.190618 type:complete len:252 (-) Transcript_72714:311-1066(-)